jgi:hypothetical protein
MRAAYADLEAWRIRARSVDRPAPSSLLELDDSLFTWHPISEIARLSLVAAGEHLRLASAVVEDSHQVFPSAHFTVMRGALVGAAQAVWILGASEAEVRQDRGLCIIGEMYAKLGTFYNEQLNEPLNKADKQAVRDQIQWRKDRSDEVAAARHTKVHFEQTAIVGWALDHCFPDRKHRSAGRLLWRQMSADAHVLGWGMFQRGEIVEAADGLSLGVGESATNLEDIVQPFVLIHQMLKEGWSMFDRLCETRASGLDVQRRTP